MTFEKTAAIVAQKLMEGLKDFPWVTETPETYLTFTDLFTINIYPKRVIGDRQWMESLDRATAKIVAAVQEYASVHKNILMVAPPRTPLGLGVKMTQIGGPYGTVEYRFDYVAHERLPRCWVGFVLGHIIPPARPTPEMIDKILKNLLRDHRAIIQHRCREFENNPHPGKDKTMCPVLSGDGPCDECEERSLYVRLNHLLDLIEG